MDTPGHETRRISGKLVPGCYQGRVMKKVIYKPEGAAGEYADLAINLYDGCTGGCRYCYVPGLMRRSRADFHRQSIPRHKEPGVFLEQIRRQAWQLQAEGDKRRIHLCFTCDPYPEDSEFTRQVLAVLKYAGRPVSILTKQAVRAQRDFDLLEQMDAHFGVTQVFSNPEAEARCEPGTSTGMERHDALKEARSRGIHTWVSVEPVLNAEQALDVISYLWHAADEFRVGKLNHHPDAARVNWPAFAWDAVVLLERWAAEKPGRTWMLKKGLAELVEES